MRSRFQVILVFTLAALMLSRAAICRQEETFRPDPADVTEGPASLPLSDGQLNLALQEGLILLNLRAAQQYYTSAKQPIPPNMLCVVTDPASDVNWFADVSYQGFGHIDDEGAAEALRDSDKLLKELQDNTRDAYAKRPASSALAPTVVGWYRPPVYNAQTHTLTTAVLGQYPGGGDQTVHFTKTVLGRYGGASITIVGNRQDAVLLEAQQAKLDPTVRFAPGKDYASWQPADGKSGTAFTSLITGNAAVAAKTGLLANPSAYLLPLLLVLVAVLATIAFWIKFKFTGKPTETAPTDPNNPPNV